MTAPVKEFYEPIPSFPRPKGFATDADYLKHLVLMGVAHCWQPKPPIDTLLRLHRELDIICRGCPRYFLIFNDLAKAARNHGVPFILNQGAQCGCAVLYALGLTSHDPVKRGLPFERFINPDFAEHGLADINTRTDASGREWIVSYLVRKYGITHVARIAGYARGIVLTKKDVGDILPVTADPETGILTTQCLVKDVLMANVVKFDFDAERVHPIVEECLRETNGILLYQEQLAEMIHIISGKSLSWAMWTMRNLAIKKIDICDTRKISFVNGALANLMFRIDEWENESVARAYLDGLWNEWYKFANRLVMYTHIACADPVPRLPTTRTRIGDVSLADIANALHRRERVAIVMRHAERPPLPPNDPTFGKDLPITDNGRKQADAFGFALFEYCRGFDTCIHAGVSTRCQQTAIEIAKYIERGISLDFFLGSGSPFFGEVSDRLKLADAGNYRDSLNTYFRTGKQQGFNDLAESTDAFEKHIWEDNSEQLGIYVTNDLNVACLLAGRGVMMRFEDDNWPTWLEAAVMFLGKYGHARYGYMRSLDSKFSIDG